MNKEKEWRPLPDSITIRESKIEGLGVFATKDLPSETDLGISHVYDNRFPDNYIRPVSYTHLTLPTSDLV